MFIATAGGIGYVPVAPGTAGTAVGLLLLLILRLLGGVILEIVVLALVIGLGVWAANFSERQVGSKDPGFVVIDEVAGILLTMFCLPLTVTTAVFGFFLFRLFDIFKPFPSRSAERLPGGFGIMADDLVAGLYAAVILRFLVDWLSSSVVP